MAGNPWDNDPIVSAAPAAAPNPWDNDPIVSTSPATEAPEEESYRMQNESEVGAGEAAASVITGGIAQGAGGLGYGGQFLINRARDIGHAIAPGLVNAPTVDPLDVARSISSDYTYQPRTEQGQGAVKAIGEGFAAADRPIEAAEDVLDPSGQLKARARDVAERANYLIAGAQTVAPFMRIPTSATSFETPPAPPKLAPGPITATELRAAPDRLPPATPEGAPAAPAPSPAATPPARVPVPGKPHIRPLPAPPAPAATAAEAAARIRAEAAGQTLIKGMEEPEVAPVIPKAAPAAAAPLAAPLAAPARDEAEIAGTAPTQAQAERVGAIRQLQQDTGAVMPQVRNSAVTGDYRETGTDYQLAELGDPTMRTQIDQENAALRAGSQAQVDSAGGVARGVGQAALEQRGGIIDRALQGIGDWFDRNIRQTYQRADQLAGGVPMTKFDNLQGLLADHSQFTGVEGKQLHADISQVAQQFGMMGSDGFWKPTTVQTAERFRQWLGEQYTPRTGRVIARAKDALDSDVAAHGGQGLYDAGRALRYKRDQMLEGPKGIARLMPEKLPDGRLINRAVPLDKIADNIANMPREQFDHVVNVLHDSSKLGNGELAEGNAAALNELRRHMAERLHEAGTGGRDGMWNPYDYHEQLDAYSTKLPAVFSPEGIRRFNTIHDAGNALRLNKRYPGAAKQIMQAGGLRALAAPRIAGLVEGTLTGFLGPAGGAAAEATGLAPALRKGVERVIGGNTEARQAAQVGGRLQPLALESQRGGPKFENNASGESAASLEAQNRARQENAAGQHRYQIDPDGNVTPLRGVDAVDAKAPAGHVIVQRGVGMQPYTVLDRGGLPPTQANGLVTRAQGLGKLAEAERAEQIRTAQIMGGKQRGGPMSVAPGHEAVAKEQGWDTYNPDHFRMHDNRTASEHATDFNPADLEGPHPNATVKNAIRSPYPGIYDPPKDILSRLSVAPEDPILKQLFGVTRKDLHDIAMNREGNLPGTLPGAAENPKGSRAAANVMTKENEDRLVSILNEAKKNDELRHGMVGWYVMDPLHKRAVELLGRKGGTAAYSRLNTLMGMASPGSDVMTEINRGTAANMMATQGKFPQFLQHGGKAVGDRGRSFPAELSDVSGHPYHRTAQGKPMEQYLKTGEVQMQSPKVPLYIQASGTPETGFQTNTPVGDSHWSRGVGLADVRTAKNFGSSVRNPEMSALAPWYRKIAKRVGLPAVSAQALQWGALGGETGVETAVGAPKLELLAKQIKVAADRAGVTPEEMRDRIIRGLAHAG